MSKQPERLGDAPIEPEYQESMVAVAKALDEWFNGETALPRSRGSTDQRKVGFILLVFPFGEKAEGRCNYISNGADRRDVVTMMKEQIKRFEGQPEVTGRA